MSASNVVMTSTAAASVTTGSAPVGESSPGRVVPRDIDVQWPDPSPLQSWWKEVMDGVPMPRGHRFA